MEQLAEAISAAAGGSFSAFSVYPIEVVKTRMQASTDTAEDAESPKTGARKKQTALQLALKVFAAEGVGVYRGVEYSMFQSSMGKFFYYYIYSFLKVLYEKSVGSLQGNPIANVFIGYLSEMAHLPLTLPLEACTVRIQTAEPGVSAFDTVRDTLAEGGYYRSFPVYLVLCLKPAIQDTVFDKLKAWALSSGKSLSMLQTFIIGAIARTVATVIVYPYIRAKTLVQARRKSSDGGEDSGASKRPSILKMLLGILNNDGITGLFRGIDAELTRGVLSAALMLVAKERINQLVMKSLRSR